MTADPSGRSQTIVGLQDIVIMLSPSGRVAYFNSAAEKHFALSRTDVLGIPIDALASPELSGLTLKKLADEAKVTPGSIVREIPAQDGSERVLEIKASALPDGVQFLVSDKSEVKRLQTALGRYVSPSVLDAMGRTGFDPMTPRRQEVTVLSARLLGFLADSARLPADEVKALVDEFVTVQVDVLFESGATLDKSTGDSIVALFGAPVPAHDHALWAINTALKMRSAHRRLLDVWRRKTATTPAISIGIATGEVVCGTFGSFKRSDYTIVGPAGAIADAICVQTEPDAISASQRTFELTKDILTRHPGAIYRPVKFRRGDSIAAAGSSVDTVQVAEL